MKDAVSACCACDDDTSVSISTDADIAYDAVTAVSACDDVPSREPVIPPSDTFNDPVTCTSPLLTSNTLDLDPVPVPSPIKK